MYYDAHTHLNEDRLYEDRKGHIQRFADAGGKGMINVGVDADWNQRAVEIARLSSEQRGKELFVRAAIGIHPSEVSFNKVTSSSQVKEEIGRLKMLYEQHPSEIVAIGECGIDAHYTDSDYTAHKGLQQELFNAQCELARELKLPIVIHSRDQFEDTLDIIKNYTDLKVYFHCRGYGPDELEILHNLLPNFRFGCCGNITYPNAEKLRNSLRKGIELGSQPQANDHKIHYLLETDAPYLTPQKNRGKLNTPAQVVDIYEYVATNFSIPLNQLQYQVTQNFEQLFCGR